jgi:DNA-directed RNA polymerase subunit K/omega
MSKKKTSNTLSNKDTTDQESTINDETSETDINSEQSETDNEDDNLDEQNDDEEEEDIDEDDGEGDAEISSDIETTNNDKELCIYDNVDNNNDTEQEEVMIFDDDANEEEPQEYVDPEDRITKNVLSNYERVRILGDRTKQLTLGAKAMIKNTKGLDAKEIALLELKFNVMPFIIIRTLPSGKKEKWYIRELLH